MKADSPRWSTGEPQPERLEWLNVRRSGGRPQHHQRLASSGDVFVTEVRGCGYREMRGVLHAEREYEPRASLVSEVVKVLVHWSLQLTRATSSLLEDARAQLDELAKPSPGSRDDCGSNEVPGEVVTVVRAHLDAFEGVLRRLLPVVDCEPPWLAASDDGSVGIEWQHESRTLAMTYDASGSIDYYAQGPGFEQDGEIVGEADVRRLAAWLFLGQW